MTGVVVVDGSRVALTHKPPDTAIISPVTHRASSDARNTATGAMSFGCPIRPNGVCWSSCLKVTANDTGSPGAFGLHLSGTNRIHTDFSWA